MADAKKPDKGKAGGKPAAPSGPSLESNLVMFAIVALMLIFIILPAIFKLFGFSGTSIFPPDFWDRVTAAFESFVSVLSYVSIFISLVFICGIIYANTMYAEVKKKLEKASQPVTAANAPSAAHGQPGMPTNAGPDPRWRDIEGLMQSGNAADWRIAILEADILLEDMLTQMGYQGQSIGDRLKQVDRAHFATLNDAWEAHKVRNTIAHEGASFQLSRTDAENTIARFKKVFDEFYFV